MSVVASGQQADGSDWSIVAYAEEEELYTFLRTTVNGRTEDRGGFGGPPIWSNQLINSWVGYMGDKYEWVLVRVVPEVQTVDALDALGNRHEIALSAENLEFGLKFGAARIPRGADIVEIVSDPPSRSAKLFKG